MFSNTISSAESCSFKMLLESRKRRIDIEFWNETRKPVLGIDAEVPICSKIQFGGHITVRNKLISGITPFNITLGGPKKVYL